MSYQEKLLNIFGNNNYNYIINKHNDVIIRLNKDNYIDEFIKLYKSYNENLDFLSSFYASVRVILISHYKYDEKIVNHKVQRTAPDSFKSMNFLIKSELLKFEDLKNVSLNHIYITPRDELLIDKIGIDNLLRFEKDTGYLSKEINVGFTVHNFFYKFCYFLYNNQNKLSNRILNYDEFLDLVCDYIIYLKREKENGVYLDYQEFPNYFKKKYKDLYIDEDVPEELKIRFYLGELDLGFIKNNLNFITYIKDKNIHNVLFDKIDIYYKDNKYNFFEIYSNKFGNESLIELITSFADLLQLLGNKDIDFSLNKNLVDKQIRSIIYKELKNNNIKYGFIANSKSFNALLFKKEYNELFLEEDAPNELKKAFYDGLSFKYISSNRRYLKLIKEKDFITSIIKKEDIKVKEFFDILKEDSFRLILNNPDTISKALKEGELEKLCYWYIKTGRKYIPDYEVIKFFDSKETDKFVLNKNKWKSLLKSISFSEEGNKEVLIKLAYLFGVFDGDDVGYRQIQELLLSIPKHIYKKDSSFIDDFGEALDDFRIVKIKKTLIKEGFEIKNDNFIYDLYKKNKDGSYTLMINMQEYPKSTALLRNLMEECELSNVLTPSICNDLFYNFKMSYNKEFKELFLYNIRDIIKDNVLRYYISFIQRKFDEIKKFYNNRKLTLDMCLNYVRNNILENVEVGNEILADNLSKYGYTQEQFEKLQRIYDIGKQRIYSSIPRITGTYNNYRYEIVRLDSELPLYVGDITTCCQRLGLLGESSMIHSMTDKNGRLFVVYDEDGDLVSESWVWRNKDVLCFDNIEVPIEVMSKNGYRKGFFDRKIRTNFGDELLEVYLDLCKKGKITKEQYEDLCLKKITIGEGYSSIAGSLSANLMKDIETEEPLPYRNPIDGDNYLYIRDSKLQYLVLNRKEKKSIKKTLPIYFDDFRIIKNNIKELEIFKIKREEQDIRKDYSILSNLDMDSESFFNELNDIYNGLNIKILTHSCFTIIYDQQDKIIIKDILYNTNIDKKVLFRLLKMALKQLSKNNKLELDNNVKELVLEINKTKR